MEQKTKTTPTQPTFTACTWAAFPEGSLHGRWGSCGWRQDAVGQAVVNDAAILSCSSFEVV